MVAIPFLQFLTDDGIRFTQGVETLAGDVPNDADTQTGAREGLAVNDLVGQTEFLADQSSFVLEEETQWLNQFEIEIVRQPAHIVMAFDRC